MLTEQPSTFAEFKEGISAFIKNNPASNVTEMISEEETVGYAIIKPWNDESLAFFCNKKDSVAFSNLINDLKLPPLLSAIVHVGTKTLEVIWTCYRISDSLQEVASREFEFIYKGTSFDCKFGPSSQALLNLAGHIGLQGASDSGFRNLQSFIQRQRSKTKGEDASSLDEPLSFFISNFDLTDDQIVDFFQHLNFYINYYDNRSVIALLHLGNTESSQNFKEGRYIRGAFPTKVTACELDPNLLSFWGAMRTANPMMDFVIGYRIIEYASIHFVEHDVLNKIRKVIGSPHFGANQRRDLDPMSAE